MKILETLFNRNSHKKDGLTQTEREAIVDLLTLGVYADNHLSVAEDVAFETLTNKMNWESKRDISYYIYAATERARQARSDEGAVEEFLNYVAERLQSPAAHSQALNLLNKLFSADGSNKKDGDFYKTVERILKGGNSPKE